MCSEAVRVIGNCITFYIDKYFLFEILGEKAADCLNWLNELKI